MYSLNEDLDSARFFWTLELLFLYANICYKYWFYSSLIVTNICYKYWFCSFRIFSPLFVFKISSVLICETDTFQDILMFLFVSVKNIGY